MEPDIDETLPMFPLGTVLFPGDLLPLHIFEPRYRNMLAARLQSDPAFGAVLIRRGREVADHPDVEAIGTAASIVQAEHHPDGRSSLVVRGGKRFRIIGQDWREGYLTSSVVWLDGDGPTASTPEMDTLISQVIGTFETYLAELERAVRRRVPRIELDNDPDRIGYAIGSAMPFSMSERQRLLAAPSSAARLEALLGLLRHERALLATAGLGGIVIAHPGRGFTSN